MTKIYVLVELVTVNGDADSYVLFTSKSLPKVLKRQAERAELVGRGCNGHDISEDGRPSFRWTETNTTITFKIESTYLDD